MKTHRALACLTLLMLAALPQAVQAEPLVFEGGDGPGQGKHIVLIAGDEEYRSEEALPMLAKILSQRHGFKCTVVFPLDPEEGYIDPNNQTNLPGLEALDDADLMIVATRFRTPSAEQMEPFDRYLAAGKPVIGLRTATHGFRGDWEYFGRQILGEEWVAHHGEHKVQGTRAFYVQENAFHPILWNVSTLFVPSDVYAVVHLTDDDEILMRGQVTESLDPDSAGVKGEKNETLMPVAWIREYKAPNGGTGKAFCTTMGAAVDFVDKDLRTMIVNACYFLTDLGHGKVVNVDYVDPYTPSFYGFVNEPGYWKKRNLRPEDFQLGKSPAPQDPPGSPEWPFRDTPAQDDDGERTRALDFSGNAQKKTDN